MDRSQTGGYVLKFISGKYQGGEFPLELDTEIEIGRGGELDMVLVEDMVSRRHARITTYGGELYIEDFGSTNGTFVNGEKIEEKTRVSEGDRILIGTNIIKLVHRDSGVEQADAEMSPAADHQQPGEAPGADRTGTPPPAQQHQQHGTPAGADQQQAPPPESGGGHQTDPGQSGGPPSNPGSNPGQPNPAQGQGQPAGATGPTQPGRDSGGGGHSTMAAPAVNQTAGAGGTMGGSISGLIEEVPLPDLLQLFSTSRKSGVLVIMRDDDVGKVFLEDGNALWATINEDYDLDPYKAFYRLIAWDEGTFSLEPPIEDEDKEFDDPMNESVESLMMEGMRILDELDNLGDTPDMQAAVQIPDPLDEPLRELEDNQLDVFQRALNHETVGDVLNKSEDDDVESMEILMELIDDDYIVTDEDDD